MFKVGDRVKSAKSEDGNPYWNFSWGTVMNIKEGGQIMDLEVFYSYTKIYCHRRVVTDQLVSAEIKSPEEWM
jgi:hypothetical protein